MDISNVVSELKAERDRIDQAIAALEGRSSSVLRRGRVTKPSSGGGKPRHMSAAARKRISEAMKQRWAKQKGKSSAKRAKLAPKKTARRRPMSAEAKRKLSALMKARWAARKNAA